MSKPNESPVTRAADRVDLRDAGFLLWLGQFVGEWDLPPVGAVQVRRRITGHSGQDGYLEASSITPYERIDLDLLFGQGTFKRPPRGPLGPYPTVLSAALLENWLSPTEASRLQNAWRVSSGMRLMLETVEKRISEMPEPERNERWLRWWAQNAQSSEPLPPRDEAAHLALYRRYRRG